MSWLLMSLMFESLPRERFAHLPTPLHRMRNLGSSLGIDDLWIKRDDLTGVGGGGNKSRKLEFIVADAKEMEADTLVTVGAVQSNHCRQTAAVAAITGMRCVLLLSGQEPEVMTGNLLLSKLFGAEQKFFPDDSISDLDGRMETVVNTLEDLGFRPYAIPLGASMPLGVIAYADAVLELREQMENWDFEPDRIIVASSTGSTLAGLILGAEIAGLDVDIIGVSVLLDGVALQGRVAGLIDRTVKQYPQFFSATKHKIQIDDRFLDEGYGVLTEGCRSAIQMFAKMEAIVLDPVYTGKAGLSLVRMALSGEVERDTRTLFWHTGGEPALYAYADQMCKS